MARPSTYRPEVADEICEAIAEGGALHRLVVDHADWPAKRTIYRWLEQHANFAQKYALAREVQADLRADEIVSIADEALDVVVDLQVARLRIDAARLRIDARKWQASKLAPKKYGDRLMHSDSDGGPVRLICEWKKPGEGD